MALKRFANDCRAGVAPLLALTAVGLFGAVGAAVDYSRASASRAAMQSATDATVFMLAKQLQQSPSSQVADSGVAYFKANFTRPDVSNLQVTATTSSANGGMAVNVSATGSVHAQLLGVIGITTINISANSAAYATSAGLGCVLSLDPKASGAVTATGSTAVTLNGCSLYDNSQSQTSLTVTGTAKISALSVGVVGSISSSGLTNITTADGVMTGMGAVTDPYIDDSYPNFSGCDQKNFSAHSTVTINPGVYCGGMQLTGGASVTLNPGIYYLDGGSLSVSGGSGISGNGVTLVFTKKSQNSYATASITGGSTVNLTPPTTGPTKGMVVFGDREMPVGTTFKFTGGGTQYFGGAVYLPTAAIQFSGGGGTSSSCTQIIGDTVTFTGNSALAINCSSYGTKPFSPLQVKLTM
jgi:hypothetical protein